MASSITTLSLTIVTLIVTIHLVQAAPIPSAQQDITDFSNSAKNVFLPFRELPERLIDDFEIDDDRNLPSESDIFYFFGASKTTVLTENTDARKRGGF